MEGLEIIYKSLQTKGFVILENIVDSKLLEDVLRIIHLDLFIDGISKREILWWEKAACWFPHLRFHESVIKLRDSLPEWTREGQPCEPQILLGPPHRESYSPSSHIDKEPDWANGRKYKLILGVPLTISHKDNGGIRAWPLDGGKIVFPILNPGDLWIMNPLLPHSGGPNMSGGTRYMIYYRFLQIGKILKTLN